MDFRESTAEALPVDDGWADVAISNGVVNLMPDKGAGRRRWRVCSSLGAVYRSATL